MHELSYVIRMVNIAEEEARRQKAKKITAMTVAIGEMTGVIPHFFEHYYPEATKGTMLEGSQLHIEEVPVQVRCENCGNTYHPDKANGYACPKCGSSRAKLLQGRDVIVKNIEIDF